MPTKRVNGVELYYEEHGQGRPVLFHHGYTGSHDGWETVIPLLADRYRCIAMDARGAGESERAGGGYTIAQYAADVVGMADALGLDRFTYVGHSMGGGIGMWLGLEHAARLDRLVLVASIPADGTVSDPALHERAAEQRRAADAEGMFRQRRALAARPESLDESRVRRAVQRALSVSEGHFEDSWRAMRDLRVGERLASLTTPTLVIAGAADGLLQANLTDFMRLPNATLHVFSRVGHGVPTDTPDRVAEVLADFMEHGVVNNATLQARLQEVTAGTR
ncbi:MAG: alpha/beta hydrolase [Chloroflexi bacterium]|nr:alpha/beta hydrolase [Chloroflexota bacterium]